MTIWSVGRWPLTLVLLVVMIAALYNLALLLGLVLDIELERAAPASGV